MMPTNAEPKMAKARLEERNASIAGSPTVSNTATSAKVTMKIKTVTCTVCESALRTMDLTALPPCA